MDGSWWKILFIMENPWKWHGWFGVPPWIRKPPHVELEMMIQKKSMTRSFEILWDCQGCGILDLGHRKAKELWNGFANAPRTL
jgi:hypothetical protein